jgi:multiple sugar transport system ATP-binding protein
MNQGVIEQVGAPLELYDTPRNLFVASFIGSPAMNFFDGTIEQTDGGAVFVAADQTKFSIDPKYKGSAGRQAVLGVRPEHFIVGDDGHPAEVMIVEPTGAETFVVARLAGELTTVLFKDRRPLAVGQTIRLKAEPEHQMVFDKATGERLAA